MSDRNDGGPAFPSHSDERPFGQPFTSSGMTLRDYFAAKAMAAIVEDSVKEGASPAVIAEGSYAMADAMLKAREAK